MLKDYKGEQIVFNERKEVWVWGDVEDASLKTVMLKIDKGLKAGWERRPAFWKSGYGRGTVKAVTVTSVTPDRREAWITVDETGERLKTSVAYLFAETEANIDTFDKIEVLQMAIKDMEADLNTHEATLTPLNVNT